MAAADVSALGEFEQVVLLAVLRLDDEAYAVSIADEILRCTGREVSRGSIYITLDRLEAKGYLKSRLADPTPGRGGRAKRYYALRPRAVEALKETRRQREPIAGDLEEEFAARIRATLVVAEMALSLMLLIGAALLIVSFKRLVDVSPGFEAQNVMTAHVTLPASRYRDHAQIVAFIVRCSIESVRYRGWRPQERPRRCPSAGRTRAPHFKSKAGRRSRRFRCAHIRGWSLPATLPRCGFRSCAEDHSPSGMLSARLTS